MLGYILKLVRIANYDMSVKEVATKCSISSTYISEVENGNKKPSISMLKKVAKIYGIPLSRIFLFEEILKKKELSYQQTLEMILEYYIIRDQNAKTYLMSNDVNTNKELIK